MAVVRGLTVAMDARSQRLRKELRRSERDVRRYSRQTRREFQNLARTTRRSLALATGAIAALSAGSLRAADDIAKSARNAGLAADEFQRLAHAFRISGSNSQTLVKSSAALSRQIFNLERNSIEARDAFDAIGVSLEDLNSLSRADQLRFVLERLRALPNATRQAAVAQALLGRAGKELGTVFATTSREFANIENRLTQLGGVIGGEALTNAEFLTDEFTVLSEVLRSQFTTGLFTAVDRAADFDDTIRGLGMTAHALGDGVARLTMFVVENRETIARVALAYGAYRVATSRLVTSVGSLALAVGKGGLAGALSAAALATRAFGAALQGVAFVAIIGGIAATVAQLKRDLDGVNEEFEHFAGLATEALESGLLRVQDRIVAIRDELERAQDTSFSGGLFGMDTQQSEIDRLTTELDQLIRAREAYRQQIERLRDVGGGAEDATPLPIVIDIQRTAQQDRHDAILRLGQIAQTARITRQGRALTRRRRFESLGDDARDRFQDNIRSQTDFSGIIEERQQAIENVVDNFTNTLASRFKTAFQSGDFSDIGDILVDTLANTLLDRVSQNLADIFGNLFDDVLGNIFAGSGGGLFGGLFGGIFHEGGTVPGPRGEPRLILAEGDETILTPRQRSDLMNRMSGNAVTNNFYLTGDVERHTLDVIRKNIVGITAGVTNVQRERRIA